ncbi:MAG: hypothetical protein M3401_06535 [Actinomycetota bacterium]|nr:hypothetical protein [Actinomycetota bacterium]
MLRRSARVVVAVAAAVAGVSGAGCGESDEASGDTRPLVTFGRTGGTEGKVYGLVVERGGGAFLTQYPEKVKRFEVDGGKRSDLRSALEDLDVKGLQPNYEPSPPTAEGHRYSVTYQGTTVQAAEKADVPKKLKSVIKMLDGLVDDEN